MIYKLSLNTLGMSTYVSLSWNCYKKTVPTPACIPEFFDQDGIMIVQLFFSVPFLLFFGLYDWFVEDDVVIGTLNEVPCWWMFFFVLHHVTRGTQESKGEKKLQDRRRIGSDVIVPRRPKRRSNGRSQHPMTVHLQKEREQEVQNASKKMCWCICYLAQYKFDWFITHPTFGLSWSLIIWTCFVRSVKATSNLLFQN